MRRLSVLGTGLLLLMHLPAVADADAFLGVYLATVSSELAREMGSGGRGVYVEGVIEGTAAERAGIKDHDVILEIDGDRIAGPSHLGELLGFYSPGDKVGIKVWRDGRIRTMSATLGRPKVAPKGKIAVLSGGPKAWLGVTVQSLTGQLGEYFGTDEGVLISSVIDDSPAANAGLKAGDVITEVDGTEIDEPVDLPAAIAEREPGTEVTLGFIRAGKRFAKTVELVESPEDERTKKQVYLWGQDDSETFLLLQDKLGGLEGLEKLERIKALEILGIPGLILESEELAQKLQAQETAILEEERKALEVERRAVEEERRALQAEMEALRKQLEELKQALKESE